MARIRTIKPEFWQDEDLAECSMAARLLAIGLLQLCDRNGVFRHIPMQIHAHVFPWEAEVNTPALLGELEGIGYVKLYRVSGKKYGVVPGFTRHQRLQGKEAKSEGIYPLLEQADTEPGSNGEYPGASRGDTGTGNREQGTRYETTDVVSAQSSNDLSATGDESNESQTEVVPPEPEAVERLPLNDNSEYPVTQTQIDEWQRLFPAVDVDQQIRGMRAWLQSNTTRRKTRKGINRFITNWLSREQDNGGNTKRGDTGGQPRLSATERYWRQRERELAAESRH